MKVYDEPGVTGTKIKEIDELAAITGDCRAKGTRVVHCHGVFDLLHIGHIRHFEEARQLGDLLVVTLTPDRFVNKGPHRPAFPEMLRAEAIAALNVVDFVAVNKWPTAVNAIKALKPDVYAKGSDYKKAEDDVTGGIILERETVESIGGRLIFTDDIVFSSTGLINKYVPLFPKEVTDYLHDFSSRYPAGTVIDYLDRARSLKVLVVGEAIVDEYVYCSAIGKSSKEPMLAVKYQSTETFAGGILAVGNHVANFCDNVGLITFLGEESVYDDFISANLSENIKQHILRRREHPTIVKRRFVDSYFFTKMLEVYEMNDSPPDPSDEAAICALLTETLPKYDLVIVIDFGHGMFSRQVIDILCEKSNFLVVNVQANAGNLGYSTISKFKRADYICVADKEIRLETRDREGDLRDLIKKIQSKIKCERFMVTRGTQGCLGYTDQEGFVEAPALANQVIDRMGAGDTFLSLTALCMALGAPLELAAFVGDAVGAQAVATVGHRRFVEKAPLYKQIEALLK